jgi:hypothetical protein
MKSRLLMGLVVALIANGAPLRTVHAQTYTLDADLFATGTDVSNAFPGVTLEAMSLVAVPNAPGPFTVWTPSYAPVYAAAGNFFSASSTANSGWGAFFGPLYPGAYGGGDCFQQCSGPQGGADFQTNLLVNFSTPVDEVNVFQIGNAFNGVALEAFDSSDQEVGYCAATPGNLQGPGNYGCYSVLSPAASSAGQWQVDTSIHADNISKILVGAYNNRGDEVDTIQYKRLLGAPEIDPSSVASGLTLLLGILMVLRGRRPVKLDSAAT